jgi:hypothetical protein
MSTVQISATPDHLQGRVASAWGLLAGVAGPAGPLAAGFLVAVGPALPFAVFGGVLVVLSLFLTASPGFRIHGPAIPERTVQWIS